MSDYNRVESQGEQALETELNSATIPAMLDSLQLPENVTPDEVDRALSELAQQIRRSAVVQRGVPAPDDEAPSRIRRILDFFEGRRARR